MHWKREINAKEDIALLREASCKDCGINLSLENNVFFFLITEAKINANAQQTQGSYEIYSGSSGGLIILEANEVGLLSQLYLTFYH